MHRNDATRFGSRTAVSAPSTSSERLPGATATGSTPTHHRTLRHWEIRHTTAVARNMIRTTRDEFCALEDKSHWTLKERPPHKGGSQYLTSDNHKIRCGAIPARRNVAGAHEVLSSTVSARPRPWGSLPCSLHEEPGRQILRTIIRRTKKVLRGV